MTARDDLLAATAELLWERGYSATSPAMIMSRSGVGQGSMYHHFSGKAGLAEAAIQRIADEMRAGVLQNDRPDRPAMERVSAYLEMEREPLRGCRLGRLVQDPEVVDNEALRTIAGSFFSWLCEWLTDIIATGQDRGELRRDVAAGEIAAIVVATVQGAFVLARSQQSSDAYRAAVAGAESLLARCVAHPADR